MPIWLKNDEIVDLLDMRGCIAAIEDGYRELALHGGKEREPSRTSTFVPSENEAAFFTCRSIEGAVPKAGTYAVRVRTELAHDSLVHGMRRKDKRVVVPKGGYHALILLYSLETAELLAILQDAYLNRMCTGANGGLGAKYLARENARRVGIIGSGWQAISQLEAVCAVRPIEEIRVFSPTRINRERFAAAMTHRLEIDVRPVDSYEEAVRAADIVITATNSTDPFFCGEWLEPGVHLTSMGGGDRFNPRKALGEVDDETYRRSNRVAVNTKEQVEYDQTPDVFHALQSGAVRWDKICGLADLISGAVRGRESESDITFLRHHSGLGLWYASAGATVYKRALKEGVGEEIPEAWFGGGEERA